MRKSLGMAMLATVVGLGLASQATAQDTMTSYGSSGLKVSSGDYSMAISTHMQQRLTINDNHDGNGNDNATFAIRRLKTNFSGNVVNKKWSYNFTYDWANSRIEVASIGYQLNDSIKLNMGSTKVDFNLEESTSSKRQTFADRSLANQAFNMDWATGLWADGSTMAGEGSLNYSLGLFNGIHGGDGRNAGDTQGAVANNDTDFMINGSVGFSPFSDGKNIRKHMSDLRSDDKKGDMDLFLGAGFNYAFLDGAEAGLPVAAPGPYGSATVGSIALDGRFHWNGLSVSAAYFYRSVSTETNATPNVEGGTHTAGYGLTVGYNMNLEGGDQLEVAARLSQVNDDDSFGLGLNDTTELGFAVNYRFAGDNLKATFDVNYTGTDINGSVAPAPTHNDDWLIRFQVQLVF